MCVRSFLYVLTVRAPSAWLVVFAVVVRLAVVVVVVCGTLSMSRPSLVMVGGRAGWRGDVRAVPCR